MGVIIGVTTIASPTTVGEGADVIVLATTVTTGHGVTRVPTRVVLHVIMIVTTDVVDAIKAMNLIEGAATTMDVTKIADVTAEGTAAANATLTPWMRPVTGPDPSHGTGMIARPRDLTRAPGALGLQTGAVTPMIWHVIERNG